MSHANFSRFSVVDVEDLPDDLRERVVEAQQTLGFVPNVFLALGRRPDELRAFFAYRDALMNREGGLSRSEREMVVVATSALNRCFYCVTSHGAMLRQLADPFEAEEIAVNPMSADLDDRQRAIVDFALKIAGDSAAVSADDVDQMRARGFNDDEIWDIGAIAALYSLSNRLANFAGIRPNPEYFGAGR